MSKDYSYLCKKNFFTKDELTSIWKEIEFLNQPHIMKGPDYTGSAHYMGKKLKNNTGVFLNTVYSNLNISPIHRYISKLYTGITYEYSQLGFHYRSILNTKTFSTLLSYYEDGDFYDEHTDTSLVTCLIWLFKEPKRFRGGDFVLPEINETIMPENNTLIMFPSHAKHLVNLVEIDQEYRGRGFGRYCITTFLYVT